ncbi:MAG: methyltransferase domain-containing protein [Parachlamydiaceae bacterium]|nr:methyltransferase domain-containing protein [Parachlamydiaceae bacterium]
MNNISSNGITLKSYEQSLNEYINGTPSETTGNIKIWIDLFLNLLPSNPRIIEIGSAFGRDAQYIESQGFSVERTDATVGFVNFLKNKGYSAKEFNILTDDFTSVYDLIFANAVFLHFNSEELIEVLKKIQGSLSTNGILAFSVKHGEGEGWSNEKIGQPRFFCYWNKDKIQLLMETLNFEVLSISEDEKFLQITAKKIVQ